MAQKDRFVTKAPAAFVLWEDVRLRVHASHEVRRSGLVVRRLVDKRHALVRKTVIVNHDQASVRVWLPCVVHDTIGKQLSV